MKPYIREHVIAYAYKLDIETIRQWDVCDFEAHLHVCLARLNIDREFQLDLAGAKKGIGPSGARKSSEMNEQEFAKQLGKGQRGTYQKNIKIDQVLTKDNL